MRIAVKLDADRLRLWHVHLVERLAAAGHAVTAIPEHVADPWPSSASVLLQLEATVFGVATGNGTERVGWNRLTAFRAELPEVDLLIDLAEAGTPDAAMRKLDLLCDGQPFMPGALAAALSGRAPVLYTRLRGDDGARLLTEAHPAIENRDQATAALSMLFGRAAAMILREVRRLERPGLHGVPAIPVDGTRSASATGFFASRLGARVTRRLQRLAGRAPQWHVAWRPRPAGEDLPVIGPSGFMRLPDDGARFYADPFLWEEQGRSFLFVEDYPYATGRGVISVAERGTRGSWETPRVVLETDCHLSYPFIFAHDGAFWMIPETSARRTVELYRADTFPDRWTLHSILLDDVDLGDATIAAHGDRWWMFAASRERWTSSWDALALYWAPSPFGPWQPHAANPVMVDRRSARPAGRMLSIDGRLVRPAQESTEIYGAALAFAEVTELSNDGYRQRVVARSLPWGANLGLHTYNRSASYEVIDLFGPRER